MLCFKEIFREELVKQMSPEECIKDFASLLRKRGVGLTQANSWISLTTLTLSYINEWLDTLTKKDLNEQICQDFMDKELVNDLYYLMDVFYFINALRLTHIVSHTISAKIDLSRFKNLNALEFNHVPIHLIINAQHIKFKLHTLALNKCTQSLECLFQAFESTKSISPLSKIIRDENGNNGSLENLNLENMKRIYLWPSLNTLVLRHDNIKQLHLSDFNIYPKDEILPTKSNLTNYTVFQNLQKLDVSNQSLRGTNDFLEHLPSLKDVNLSFNDLNAIPTFHGKAGESLSGLNLRNNKLENIRGIEKLSRLTTLDLSNNVLCTHETLKPIRYLNSLKMLRTLGNPLCLHPLHRQMTSAYINPNALIEKRQNFWLDDRIVTKNQIYSYFLSSPPGDKRNPRYGKNAAGALDEKKERATFAIYSIRSKKETFLSPATKDQHSSSTFFAPLTDVKLDAITQKHFRQIQEVPIVYPVNTQHPSELKSTSSKKKIRPARIREISECQTTGGLASYDHFNQAQNKLELDLDLGPSSAQPLQIKRDKDDQNIEEKLPHSPAPSNSNILKVSKDDIAKLIKNTASPNKNSTQQLRDSLLRDLALSRSIRTQANQNEHPKLSHTRHISVDLKKEPKPSPSTVSSSYQATTPIYASMYSKAIYDRSNEIVFQDRGPDDNNSNDSIDRVDSFSEIGSRNPIEETDYFDVSSQIERTQQQVDSETTVNTLDYYDVIENQTPIATFPFLSSPLVQGPTPSPTVSRVLEKNNGRRNLSYQGTPPSSFKSNGSSITTRLALEDRNVSLQEDDTFVDINVINNDTSPASLRFTSSSSQGGSENSRCAGDFYIGESSDNSSLEDERVGEESHLSVVNIINYQDYRKIKVANGKEFPTSDFNTDLRQLITDSEIGLITLDDRYLREKDMDGKTLNSLDLKLLIGAKTLTTQQAQHRHQSSPRVLPSQNDDNFATGSSYSIMKLDFNKKRFKHRLYAFEDPVICQEILSRLNEILNAQFSKKNVKYTYDNVAEGPQTTVYLQCLKCSHKILKDLDPSYDTCRKCKGSMIVEIEEEIKVKQKNKEVKSANKLLDLPNKGSKKNSNQLKVNSRLSSCSSAESVSNNNWIE